MPDFPQYIFREYDIRGVATTDSGRKVELTDDFTEHLGRAFGSILRARRKKGFPRIVVGRDARRSGEHLEISLEKGLAATGVEVIKIGQVPTPCTYFAEQVLDVDGAIQITGSHNPVDMNGFKMLIGGAALYGSQIQDIYQVIKKGDYATGSGSGSGAGIYIDFLPRYIDRLVAGFEPMPGLKLVADCANGTSGPAIQPAFERLGIDATVMFPEPDGSFPNHHADPTVVANLLDLQGAVKDKNAWLGVAFDGDSDRLGAVDENGNILWGDQLMIIFARDILERKPGSYIVGEVKCSKVLYDEIAKAGGIPEMYKTGHSLIKKRMKETNAVLAGEMSGHLFFQDRWMGFDDANYAALRLAEIVYQANKPLGEVARNIPRLVSTPEMRVDCPENIKFEVVKKVQDYFRSRDDVELIDIDGARVQNKFGWGLVRASNTQAVLVMRFEADTNEHLEEIQKMVESAVLKARNSSK
ncbi:MAG: phosphomannomutase/phosphoglucomutase [bacterium]|nr:phosphomannomutase/phosphoglucomutase [bacterium]